jgi:hypothetical protein
MGGAGSILIALMLGSTAAGGKPASIASAAALSSKWGIVTSVQRSPERNRLVGGVPNSFHLSGRAIDIARRPGVRHSEIEAELRRAGFVLIESLDEGDHSHFAFDLRASPRKAAADPPLQLASADTAEPTACPSALKSLLDLKARRRPDHGEGCADPSLPKPKYKPLSVDN